MRINESMCKSPPQNPFRLQRLIGVRKWTLLPSSVHISECSSVANRSTSASSRLDQLQVA